MLAVLTLAVADSRVPKVKYVVVFDFACAGSAGRGAQLADSVRLRLRRHQGYQVIDRLTTAELAGKEDVDLSAPDQAVIALMKERLGAHVAVFGQVRADGSVFHARVRCIDVSGRAPAVWTKAFSAEGERARGVIARQIVEAIGGQAEWKPPEYGDEPEPEDLGKALNVNGGFDAGGAGWAPCDHVATRLLPDPRPGRKGRVLRIFTDLDREAWLKYQHDLRMEKADPAKPPAIGTVANKYATVAGLEGVHHRGDWIEAEPGRRYWLLADMKGKTAGIFFPKVFVKGFADFTALADGISEVSLNERKMTAAQFDALPVQKRRELIAADAKAHPDRYRREVYRWYLACRNEAGGWKHYAAPFPPRGGLPGSVRWLRIEVYAYWPPGEYLFDDVRLYADPRQTASQPEAKPRTPGYAPPATRPGSGPVVPTTTRASPSTRP